MAEDGRFIVDGAGDARWEYDGLGHLNPHTDLLNRFTYHPPTPEQTAVYPHIRATALRVGELLVSVCPFCNERTMAITHLEEVVFWANAAIARHGLRDPRDPR